MEPEAAKPLHWIGSAQRDVAAMPSRVRQTFAGALRVAQGGERPEGSRQFGEGLPRQILKLIENHAGDTYRGAFVTFKECVYLLHVFKKKSASGKATPKPDKTTILVRWKAAQQDHRERYS